MSLEKTNINNSAVLKREGTAVKEFSEWVCSLNPTIKFTFTFREADKSLYYAKRQVNGFMNNLRRSFYGRACVKNFKKLEREKTEVAGIFCYEQHAEGGYHIHGFLWEPKKPNRTHDFKKLVKQTWKKRTAAYQVELEEVDDKSTREYARYCCKTFGINLNHKDRLDIKSWNCVI